MNQTKAVTMETTWGEQICPQLFISFFFLFTKNCALFLIIIIIILSIFLFN